MFRCRSQFASIGVLAFLTAILCSCSIIQPGRAPINPLKHAKVGDWVSYEILGGLIQKQTITEISNGLAIIQMDVFSDGKILKTDTEQRPLKPPVYYQTSAWGRRVGRETVTLNDQSFSCVVFKQEGVANNVITRWYSDQIPITGLVQMARNDQIILKLVDFGSGP